LKQPRPLRIYGWRQAHQRVAKTLSNYIMHTLVEWIVPTHVKASPVQERCVSLMPGNNLLDALLQSWQVQMGMAVYFSDKTSSEERLVQKAIKLLPWKVQ
jgi:hypothetical protein